MAKVLPFRPRKRRTARRSPVPADGAAIIIFPGVRYERCDGKGAPPPRRRKRR
ncbi:hypothetical protein [Chelativorans intermedius]|uniref:Uncharacterized protein n=1 Tax=Chelativorans intermedius TaxID=515947 RepID=A0ABV6DD80_9HYPH|nr:hypothetical protein [Chelativorans intermedius]MCT8999617.1 hypothetical protein [Chelativorans intermedius]